jgi:hypothetical protein
MSFRPTNAPAIKKLSADRLNFPVVKTDFINHVDWQDDTQLNAKWRACASC